MAQVDMEKQQTRFREVTAELMQIEQRFQQLVQLAQQIEAEQGQLRLKGQHLSGMLEVLRELIPQEDQERIVAEVRNEVMAQQQTPPSQPVESAPQEDPNDYPVRDTLSEVSE